MKRKFVPFLLILSSAFLVSSCGKATPPDSSETVDWNTEYDNYDDMDYTSVSNVSDLEISGHGKISHEKQESLQDCQKSQYEKDLQYGINYFGVQIITGELKPKGSVNVRTGPSIDYDIINVMHEDDTIHVIGQAMSGWYQVDIDGVIGYMSNAWLKGNTDAEEKNTVTYDFEALVDLCSQQFSDLGYPTIESKVKAEYEGNLITKSKMDLLTPKGDTEPLVVSVSLNDDASLTINGESFDDKEAAATYLVQRFAANTDDSTAFYFEYGGAYKLGNNLYYRILCYLY